MLNYCEMLTVIFSESFKIIEKIMLGTQDNRREENVVNLREIVWNKGVVSWSLDSIFLNISGSTPCLCWGKNAPWVSVCFCKVRAFRAKNTGTGFKRNAKYLLGWSICLLFKDDESWVNCLHFRLVKKSYRTSSHLSAPGDLFIFQSKGLPPSIPRGRIVRCPNCLYKLQVSNPGSLSSDATLHAQGTFCSQYIALWRIWAWETNAAKIALWINIKSALWSRVWCSC